MQEKNNEINNSADTSNTSNIFDDFSSDTNLVDEVNKIKMENNKDRFYYIGKAANYLQTFFIVILLIVLFLYSYVYVQGRDISNSNLLDPICFIILGDVHNEDTYCSSVTHLKNKYNSDLLNEKKDQVSSVLNILQKLYEVNNFTKTKEVLFLEDKSQNKLQTLKILEQFDNLKKEFDNVDKQKIDCNSLEIDSVNGLFTMSCTAYSAGYERGFKGFDGDTDNMIKGTSLSLANSFINFISVKSDFFTIMDRQKIFKSESIIGEKTDFTNKTIFNLKLKYNLK